MPCDRDVCAHQLTKKLNPYQCVTWSWYIAADYCVGATTGRKKNKNPIWICFNRNVGDMGDEHHRLYDLDINYERKSKRRHCLYMAGITCLNRTYHYTAFCKQNGDYVSKR